mmetsp:Transcript_27695/g.38511  ORF Transcript_27695/g.38511 Transcript_27695/m.38511 type:complete len:192 (+) Transcript_27695:53-628(+)
MPWGPTWFPSNGGQVWRLCRPHEGFCLGRPGEQYVDLWVYERTNIGQGKCCLGCLFPCALAGMTMRDGLGDNCALSCLAYTVAMPIVGPINRVRLRSRYGLKTEWKEDNCIFETFKVTCLNPFRKNCFCDVCVYTLGFCCCCAAIQEAHFVHNNGPADSLAQHGQHPPHYGGPAGDAHERKNQQPSAPPMK